MLRKFGQLFTVNGMVFAMSLVVGFALAGATLSPAVEDFIRKKNGGGSA